MITRNLRCNSLSPAMTARYIDYLDAMDRKDLAAFAAHLDDQVSISFNNAEPVSGKAAVLAMLGQYWQAFAGVEHDLTSITGDDRSHVLEALNHYTRHDGGKVTVKAIAATDRAADGRISAIRVYGDTGPVFAA